MKDDKKQPSSFFLLLVVDDGLFVTSRNHHGWRGDTGNKNKKVAYSRRKRKEDFKKMKHNQPVCTWRVQFVTA